MNNIDSNKYLVEDEEANKIFMKAVLDSWDDIMDISPSYFEKEDLMTFVEKFKDTELVQYKDRIEHMLDLPGRQSRAAFEKLYDDIMDFIYGDDEEEEL
jgi:hypothetical protein